MGDSHPLNSPERLGDPYCPTSEHQPSTIRHGRDLIWSTLLRQYLIRTAATEPSQNKQRFKWRRQDVGFTLLIRVNSSYLSVEATSSHYYCDVLPTFWDYHGERGGDSQHAHIYECNIIVGIWFLRQSSVLQITVNATIIRKPSRHEKISHFIRKVRQLHARRTASGWYSSSEQSK